MEKSFDFGALLRNNEKKHKSKPTQFVSVQGGIQKRLESNLKIRKSTRLTTFDQIRNIDIAVAETPAKSEAQLKIEHRRQQLEKWKEEKEKKKKEAAANKKKPFIVGATHNPMKYVPPPPPKPSTSGRVTRSQTAKASLKPKPTPTPRQKVTQSFAPKNASFKPPELNIKIPILAPPSKTKSRKYNITFEPVIHTAETQSRCKTAQKGPTPQLETRSLRSKPAKKPTPKKTRMTQYKMQSSSSSEAEAPKPIKRIQTPGPLKSVSKSAGKGVPKVLMLSSTENSSSETDSIKVPMKRQSIRNSVQIISSTSQLTSDSQSSFEDQLTTKNVTDSENTNSELSDVEVVSNKSPLNFDSTSDSGKNSDLEVLSAEKNKSCSSDVEIVELKTKTPRKSLSRSITDSGKSSDVELVQKTPLNRRKSGNFATPKNRGVPKSESNSEERLRSPKTPLVSPLTPEQTAFAKKISPCVTLSRGKDKARKEMKWKMSEGMLDVDASDIDSVEHFRRQLKSEKARMTEMCEAWEKIAEQTQLPEAVQEAVLSAVGQANLLMSKKLRQFAELVERCAKPEPGTALVTPADLHGFWDMVFMQVENIDMRFKKLEELKAQNWIEKPMEVTKKVVKNATNYKKIFKASGNSRLKEMIAAARKAKQNQESTPEIQEPPSEPLEKTFDAGFFTVRSPVRSPRPVISTPNNKTNLLKAVLSSEASRASASKNTASYAMLRASLMSKCADGLPSTQTTPQMASLNLYATPGRSILKSANVNSTKKSGKKSIKLVLFNDSDLDTSTSPFSDSMYTAAEDNSSKIDGVEELTVQDEIEDKDTEVVDKKAKKPSLKRQNATEIDERVIMTRNQRKSLNKSLNQIENENEGRVTRSRDVKEKEEKTPKKSARKTKENTPKRTSRQNKTIDNAEDLIELKTPKRSTRKKILQEVEANVVESVSTPKRMSRRRKSAPQDLLT